MVTDVRHDQHFRGLPSATSSIPQPVGPTERRGRGIADAGAKGLRGKGEGYVLCLNLELSRY